MIIPINKLKSIDLPSLALNSDTEIDLALLSGLISTELDTQ